MNKCLLATLLLSLLAVSAPAQPYDEWLDPGITINPTARCGHAMVNLNGEIYIFGGQTGATLTKGNQPLGMVLNDLWKLNGEQARWEEEQAANPPSARFYHAAVVYNGKMYVLFGTDTDGKKMNDVWQYNPGNVAWTQKTAAAPCGGRAAFAAAVAGGVVWITGGRNDQGDLQDVWTYNPGLNTWAQQPNLPYALSGHSAVSYNGVVYVYGGDHLLQSTPVGWSELFPASMPPARAHHIAVVDWKNGVMRVFGGQDPDGVELSDAWEYRFDANAWVRAGEMSQPLTQAAAAMLSASTEKAARPQGTDKAVFFGGLSGGAPTDRTCYYMPANTGVERDVGDPEDFALSRNYPNPFNPSTTIEYTVKEPCRIVLKVFDLRGREVATLVDGVHPSGFHSVRFDASGLASGMYFYRIRMGDFLGVRKMVLLE